LVKNQLLERNIQNFAGQIGYFLCSICRMNASNFLLFIVFAAVGYVIHPMLLPGLLKSEFVSVKSITEEYRKGLGLKIEDNMQGGQMPTNSDQSGTGVNPDAPQNMQPQPQQEAHPQPEIQMTPDPEMSATLQPSEQPEAQLRPTISVPATTSKPEPILLTKSQVIDLMKASVRAGNVSEFNFVQVISWDYEGEDGQAQIGVVSYKPDTIFEVEQIKAKARIENGKLVKWLWHPTNAEMR